MDPVTLAVVRGALEQITDEMDLNLIRAALSPIISETHDCAHGLYDARTGETIAQGGYGLPMFLANMQFTVASLLPIVEAAGGFRPGDIWITNDPYLSGTHLNDVILVSPYFVDGQLFALFANTGHWMDLGGPAPGGWVPTAREIHQEGLVIPPLRIIEGGRRSDGVISMITGNVRLPQQLLGDLAAMINVFAVGRRGLDALVARYGLDTLKTCIAEMSARSEADMRSYIAEIPDGDYSIEEWFDNDGVEDKALAVRLKLSVKGSDLHLDFTGTDGPSVGPMNISAGTTRSLCLVALKHNVLRAFANIDVLLKQRHDELPKLVDTCRQYMQYEQQTLEKVMQARSAVFQAREGGNVAALGAAEQQLRAGLGQLFAVAENYPQLKASESFQQLQQRITVLEESIADRRELYNEQVQLNNTRIDQFPDVLVARRYGFTAKPLLEFTATEKADVDVGGLFRKS